MQTPVIYNILFLVVIIGLVLYIHNTNKVYEGIANLVSGDPVSNDIVPVIVANSVQVSPAKRSLHDALGPNSTIPQDISNKLKKISKSFIDNVVDTSKMVGTDNMGKIKQELQNIEIITQAFIQDSEKIQKNVGNPDITPVLKSITDPEIIKNITNSIVALVSYGTVVMPLVLRAKTYVI